MFLFIHVTPNVSLILLSGGWVAYLSILCASMTVMSHNYNLFIVPSVINPAQTPLSYYHIRSVFTPEQRYQQTLAQLDSIRAKVPNSYIVMVEASVISEDMKAHLRSKVDLFLDASCDITVRQATDSIAKGHGEVAQLLHYLDSHHFQEIKQNCATVSKFGGRIKMSDDYVFNIPSAPRIRLETPSSMYTVLYTMPISCVDDYIDSLHKCVQDSSFIQGAHHASIEHKLFQVWLQNRDYELVANKIGVEGYCAPFGTFYQI